MNKSFNQIGMAQYLKLFNQYKHLFSEREASIVAFRWQKEGHTMREAGAKFNVSAERIRQIESRIIERLAGIMLKKTKEKK